MIALTLLPLAFALQSSSDINRGSDLFAQCKTWVALADRTRPADSDAMFDAGMCLGYVSGFVDVVAAGSSTVCFPPTTAATVVRVYVAYMEKNPKALDKPREVSLALALADAYPCPAK